MDHHDAVTVSLIHASAYAAGYTAYATGAPEVPETDPTVMSLVEQLPEGGDAAEVYEAFKRGYARFGNEEAARILAED